MNAVGRRRSSRTAGFDLMPMEFPRQNFEELRTSDQEMAAILLFGTAYNAWKIKENYSCKNQIWCLVELGGIAILCHGLTLRRGGFLEGRSAEFRRFADAT